MKISILCQSLLLTKALEIFLKDNLVSYKKCDFVICDRDISVQKPKFKISNNNGSNINVPFLKSTLMIELEKFYNNLNLNGNKKSLKRVEKYSLEKRIDILTKKFRDDLIKTIKEYYEN